MVCTHLRELYDLCQQQQIRLGSSDLVRIVCKQCGEQEVCPSALMEEFDATPTEAEAGEPAEPSAESSAS